jgi:hypothetical protein
MSPARLTNYGPGRGPRARPIGRPCMARNSNGPGRHEIQTIRAFSGLGRAGRSEYTPIVVGCPPKELPNRAFPEISGALGVRDCTPIVVGCPPKELPNRAFPEISGALGVRDPFSSCIYNYKHIC